MRIGEDCSVWRFKSEENDNGNLCLLFKIEAVALRITWAIMNYK